ncbi:MAG: amidohydrolase family protein [Chloroflexota bacterium]|nr:amidohydrolase family protein [Chloroflexota bacterium]
MPTSSATEQPAAREERTAVYDAAQYLIEPPDLWTSRLPSKLMEWAPKVVTLEGGGEAWSFQGGAWLRPLGLNTAAGRGPLDLAEDGYRYSELRTGTFDAAERLNDMDLDGTDRAALFPTFGLEVRSIREAALHRACVRAYNDGVADWVSRANGRIDAHAILPLTGLDDAMAELNHAIELGFRGVVFGGWPSGEEKPQPEDDRFWGRCAEAGMVVALVKGGQLGDRTPVAPARYAKPDDGVRVVDVPPETRMASEATIKNVPLAWLTLTGVLDRFAALNLALIGCGAGWLRYCGELFDWNFRYAQFLAFTKLREHPSEYLRRQVKATIDRERYVVEMVDDAWATGLLWASHYPTHMSTWPDSRPYLETLLGDIRSKRAQLLLRGNYEALYPSRTRGPS